MMQSVTNPDTFASAAFSAAAGLFPVSTTDWIQAVAAAVTAIVSIVLLWQLRMTKEQLKSGVKWNKLNAAFTYYNSDLVLQREKEVAEALNRAGVDFYQQTTPLTTPQLDAIHADREIYAAVRSFLNLIEDYCTAVHIGAIDEDAAFAMNSALVMRWHNVFEPFIDRRRVETGDAESLCEIEKLAKAWRDRDALRSEEHKTALRDAADRVKARLGVTRKV